MRNISSVRDLKDAISELEFNKAVHRRMLKDSFNNTMENLKPGNVFKNITGVFTNPSLLANIIPAAVGLGVGYVSNKITNKAVRKVGGTSRLKRVLITLVLYGVSRALVRSPEVNRFFGKRLAHSVFG
jgi:hypothetical protein